MSRTPMSSMVLHWWFLTWNLEERVILDVIDHHDVILYLCAKVQLSSMIKSVWRTPVLDFHTWRMLMVPDQVLGGLGHTWHHGSPWHVILDLCAKFQLYSMVGNVSRPPCHWWPYLEDIHGSWPGTWRTGSSSISWIILVCNFCFMCKILAL